MRNLFSAITLFTLLLLIVFATGCNDDSEAPSVLQFVSSTGSNYVSENRNVAGGTPVITGIYAQAPSDNVDLTNFKVTFSYDTTAATSLKNEVIYLDSTLAPDTKVFTMPVMYTPRNLANREIWRFTITDSNNKTYRKEIRIKTTSANLSTAVTRESPFYTYQNVLLSRAKNPENPLGGSLGLFGFATATGTYFPAYAVRQPAVYSSLDFTLNNTATQKPNLNLVGSSSSFVLTALTPDNFNGITSVTNLKNAYPADASGANKLENLKKDQVLAFKTIANKVGLLKIDSVYKTLDSLGFDVKVEK